MGDPVWRVRSVRRGSSVSSGLTHGRLRCESGRAARGWSPLSGWFGSMGAISLMTMPPVGARQRAPRGRMDRQPEATGGAASVRTGTLQRCKVPGRLAGASIAWYISSGSGVLPRRVSMVRAWSELGSPLRSQLVALAPPYRTHASLSSLESGESLPLGSVVLGKGDSTIAVLAELTALSHRSPWAIPCLAVPAREEILKPLLMLVTELRDRLVLVTRGVAHADEVAHVVACV